MRGKKWIGLLTALCLVFALTISASAVYSNEINLRSDYKGATSGVLAGVDYPKNSNITDLTEDYQPWMQAAVGEHFTEEYLHQYQVYWMSVEAGVIAAGEDLDLSLVIHEGNDPSGGEDAGPKVTVVAMDSSVITLPENYQGKTGGVLAAADYPKRDGITTGQPYEAWMRMEYGGDFTEAYYHEYQVYYLSVEAGIIAAGEDLDLGLVLDTMIYSDGTTALTELAQQAKDQAEYAAAEARYRAMRVPTAIISAVLLVVILAITIVVLIHGSNKRYAAYLAGGGAQAKAVQTGGNRPKYTHRQDVTLNLFGNQVPVEVQADEDLTVFTFSYSLDGRSITASGEIRDGIYTVTEDPSKVGGMVIRDIEKQLSDQWQIIN